MENKKNDTACINNDKEIYSRIPDDYYSPKIFVTDKDGIGINVGGLVFVRKIEDWHKLARTEATYEDGNFFTNASRNHNAGEFSVRRTYQKDMQTLGGFQKDERVVTLEIQTPEKLSAQFYANLMKLIDNHTK